MSYGEYRTFKPGIIRRKSKEYSYIILPDDTLEIFDYHGTSKDIVIPSVIDGKKVSTISGGCFNPYFEINSVLIPEGIKTIKTNAFGSYMDSCYAERATIKIKKLFIPASTTNIKNGAFSGCSELESIKVHPNNPVYDSRDNCNAIINTKKKVLVLGCVNTDIPDGIKKIGSYAFANCVGLEEITIPDSVDTLGDRAFYFCLNLSTINIPRKIKSLGNATFCGCKSLSSFDIPNGINKIGNETFSLCHSLESIYIPNTVVKIGNDAFKNSALKSIEIPSSVNDLGQRAFALCFDLETVSLSDKIKKIKRKTFLECHSLKHIDMPLLLEEIEESAFNECVNLEKIVLPNFVRKIGDSAFYHCKNATTVTLGESIEEILPSAFVKCAMSKIRFPKSIKKIGSNVLLDCPNLEIVEFEDTTNLKSFFRNNFESLPKLQKIVIENNVTNKIASAITTVALINNNVLLLEDKILDALTKSQFREFDEWARTFNMLDICNLLIIAYNRNFGNPSSIRHI